MKKTEIVSYFDLHKSQIEQIEFFISSITNQNQHINLVGRSTIDYFWQRHILDCLQLTAFIESRKSKIIDLGSGPGLPGILLSIAGYQNVLMVESIKKKTDFVEKIIKDLSLSAKILNTRIEKLKKTNQDIVVSRALAPLSKLLTYTLMHSNKNTTSLFLKGRSVNNEIKKAMQSYSFDYKKIKSISSDDGCVLEIKNIKEKHV